MWFGRRQLRGFFWLVGVLDIGELGIGELGIGDRRQYTRHMPISILGVCCEERGVVASAFIILQLIQLTAERSGTPVPPLPPPVTFAPELCV